MYEPSDRVGELKAQAADARVRVIESNKLVIAELSRIWHELNETAAGQPEVRKHCEHVAADIARLEKLNLAFDTEWLAEAKRDRL